jgi:hypothetical protein
VFIDDDSKCKTDYDNPYKSITDNRIFEAERRQERDGGSEASKTRTRHDFLGLCAAPGFTCY